MKIKDILNMENGVATDWLIDNQDEFKLVPVERDEYTEELSNLSKELIVCMENMLSIVDPKRTPTCGNIGAANQAALLIDEYHKLNQDFSND